MSNKDIKLIRSCGFRAKFLKPLFKIMAKNDVRHYLNGLSVQENPEGEGVILTVTDGHRLLTVLDPKGYTNGSWICNISSSLVSASLKASKSKETRQSRNDAVVTFVGNGGYVYGGVHDIEKSKLGEMQDGLALSEFSSIIDGKYPKIGRLFSKLDDGIDAKYLTMNAEYLKDCGDVFLMLGNPSFQGLTLLGQSNNANVFGLTSSDSRDFDARMLIMPLTPDENSQSIAPSWIESIIKKEEKESNEK